MPSIIILTVLLLAPAVLYWLFQRLPSPYLRILMPAGLASSLAVIVPHLYQFQTAGPEGLAGILTILTIQVLGILTPLPSLMERCAETRRYPLVIAISGLSFVFMFLRGFAGDFNVPPLSEAGTPDALFFTCRLLSTYLIFLIISASICGFILFLYMIREDYPDIFSKTGWITLGVILAPLLCVTDCYFIASLAAAIYCLTRSISRPWLSLLVLALLVSSLLAYSEVIITLYHRHLLVLLLSDLIISLGVVAASEALSLSGHSCFSMVTDILSGVASVKIIGLSLTLAGYPELFIMIPELPLAGFVLAALITACTLIMGERLSKRLI